MVRRRQSSRLSSNLRKRHNAVLNVIAEWVHEKGLARNVRDQPLYKNELLKSDELSHRLKQKSRAPDLMGLKYHKDESSSQVSATTTTLVIIEVAVASDPESVRTKKLSKYSDLVAALSSSHEYSRCELFALVFHEDGTVPDNTRQDLVNLAMMLNSSESPQGSKGAANALCDFLQDLLSSFG